MRLLVCLLLVLALTCSICAKPAMNKTDEAKGFLLEKSDLPALKESYCKQSKWAISDGRNNTSYSYVTSIRQRWWKAGDRMEVVVEAGMFPSQEDALKAAELRLKELKERNNLQEQALKGGEMPGNAKGDRSWGVFDPPEQNAEPNQCRRVGPVSTFAAVLLVKKDVCVQVSAESRDTNVSLDDMERLARKIAAKINTAKGIKTDDQSQKQPEDQPKEKK